nr:putative ribonuclease H-like domain-containing protein [Tanacetum cinerariifolium]
NADDDAAFGGKKPEFEGEKPESEVHVSPSSSAQTKKHDDKTKREAKGKIPAVRQISTNNTNTFNADGPSNTVVSLTHEKSLHMDSSQYPDDPNMPSLEDITYSDDEKDVGADADFTNLETNITASPIPTTRVHKDHHVTQIIGDLSLATQIRSMISVVKDQGGLTQINNKDFHTCMFACFLSQEEPKRVHQALKDPSWIEAMQEELLQFKMQKVWVLVDLPNGKRAIGTKWVFRNNKDERGIVVRNKARFVAQGHTHEEGIDYEEVFAPIARIEAVRLFLDYASFMGFMVYQMDVKSAFLCETIEEEVYVCQPLGFEDPDYPDKVYKMVKALYRLHQAPRAWYETLANYLLENGFQRGKIDQTLFIKRKSTTGGYQFLGCRLISWQCKKQAVVATSSTEAEYVAAVSDVTRLQALVDRKKVIITKATIREALRLDDVESINCLPNEEIFIELSRMGTSCNEFSSSMASAVICLSRGAISVDVDDVPAATAELSMPLRTPTTQPPPQSQELPSTSQVIPTLPPSLIAEPSSPPQQQQPSQPTHNAEILLDLLHTLTETWLNPLEILLWMIYPNRGEIIANMDANEDVTLKDVAKEVAVEKDADIEENADV